jgi:hypothetical protein
LVVMIVEWHWRRSSILLSGQVGKIPGRAHGR